MNNNILMAANMYAAGLKNIEARRAHWLDVHKQIREQLMQIAAELNQATDYKQNFNVDVNHAYNEEINGTCAQLPSLTLRTGSMPMNVTFKNASGETKEYAEQGFHLTFTPTIAGEILIMLLPHYSDLSGEAPKYATLAAIDDPLTITPDMVETIVARGIEMAFYSSFTGMVELQKKEEVEEQKQYEHTPIGFKRYDSTEKVK